MIAIISDKRGKRLLKRGVIPAIFQQNMIKYSLTYPKKVVKISRF
jgi:hypothetical protein